jgi:hypothetical protein
MIEKAFRTLGLEPGAKPEEIRAAYRRLAKRNHPDKFAYDPRQQAQATTRMKEINAAYRALRPYLEGTPRPSPTPPPRPPPRQPAGPPRRPPPRTARHAPYRTDPGPELGRNVLRVFVFVIMLILFISQLKTGGLKRTATPSWPGDPLSQEQRERIRRQVEEEFERLERELRDPRNTPEDVERLLREYLERVKHTPAPK